MQHELCWRTRSGDNDIGFGTLAKATFSCSRTDESSDKYRTAKMIKDSKEGIIHGQHDPRAASDCYNVQLGA